MLWMDEEADDFLEEADNSGLPVTQPLGTYYRSKIRILLVK